MSLPFDDMKNVHQRYRRRCRVFGISVRHLRCFHFDLLMFLQNLTCDDGDLGELAADKKRIDLLVLYQIVGEQKKPDENVYRAFVLGF